MLRSIRVGLPVVALLSALALAGPARANGRPPETKTTTTEQSPGQRLCIGATFGLLASSDLGTTWQWICEPSIYVGGLAGAYDPIYVISPTGTLFAGLTSGLSVSRDQGCTWQLASGLANQLIRDVHIS